MPRLRTRIGRVSELVDLPSSRRSDWSDLNAKLKLLEPGQQLEIYCPANITIPAFRSTILTTGHRIHKGEWRLCTRTEGQKIHCFLARR